MYLKRLDLFGFKSFADKTTLNFEAGITAVVGPNGCGKSNVFDAIRWVLGEQSSKELRGSSMTDVVFNGTERKPSLGFAEVSLTFDNKARNLPHEADEVSITRRLFRSGESEYLINKSVSRLKNIHEMFMGTGVGAEAYSMVQQGKVDLIVNARAEDRRVIFDEASGITRYKARKKEALGKLKDTDDNLLRVNDIVTEVKRQIASIERQANKARRYKEEFEKLKDLEIKLARQEISQFDCQKDGLEGRLRELKDRESALNREHDDLAGRLTHEINYLDEVEQKVAELRSREIKIDGQIDINKNEVAFNEERVRNLKDGVARLRDQKQSLTEKCALQRQKIMEVEEEIRRVEETAESRKSRLEENRELFGETDRLIHGSRNQIKEHEEKILGLTSRQVHIRNNLTDIMKEHQGALARQRRLDLEGQKVMGEKQDIDFKLRNMCYQISCLQGALAELELFRDSRVTFVGDLNRGLDGLENKIRDLERKRVFLESQKEFIEKLNTQYQDIPDPVVQGRLITEMSPEIHHTGIIGKVKSVRAYSPEPSVLPEGSPDPAALFEISCETKFIELDPQQISLKILEIERDTGRKNLEHQELLLRIREEEERLDLILADIQDKEKSFSILEAQKKDIFIEVDKLRGELDLVEFELREVKETLERADQKEKQLSYELDTVGQELCCSQDEIRAKQEEIAALARSREELGITIAQLEAEWQSLNEKKAALEKNKVMFGESLDGWLDEMGGVDEEVRQSESRLAVCAEESGKLRLKIAGLESEKESVGQERESAEALKEEMSVKINSVRQGMSAVEEEADQIQKAVHDLQMGEQKLIFGVRAIKDRLQQAYKVDIDRMMEAVRESLKWNEENNPYHGIETPSPEVVALLSGPNLRPVLQTRDADQFEVFNIEEARHEIQRLRKRCESFGSVNLDAMDEYEDLKRRFEFLTSQQSDLLEAKSQLMSTINKINRSTRQLFMDTFTRVGEEFRIYFRMLFGGGEAELVLMDPENVLESGIDIVARPPGKKLQNISLLSGGEKTLTAIALIFGVFKVNPSPFCVLDEIDAALDESNVGRFSYLLKDFSKIAQFIVITHNKKTISVADVLYGVTMPETGVSRIVSVKFAGDAARKEEQIAAVV
jgi:chromosome segregation protein